MTCRILPLFALYVGMAKPKSISLTLKGRVWWLTSTMLSGFISVWITPRRFSASKAMVTCKFKVSNTVKGIWTLTRFTTDKVFSVLLHSWWYCIRTCWMMVLMSLRSIGAHWFFKMYFPKLISSNSNTKAVPDLTGKESKNSAILYFSRPFAFNILSMDICKNMTCLTWEGIAVYRPNLIFSHKWEAEKCCCWVHWTILTGWISCCSTSVSLKIGALL